MSDLGNSPPVSHTGEDMSLVRRLVRIAAIWAIPALLVTTAALIWFYRSSTYRIFDDPLESTIQALIASTETDSDVGGITLSSQPIDPRYQLALSGRYWVIGQINDDGRIKAIRASRSLTGESLALPTRDITRMADDFGVMIKSNAVGPDNEPLRVAAQTVIFPNTNDMPVVIMAAADIRPAAKEVRNFAGIAFGLLGIMALGLVYAIFAQVRVGLRPLFTLRNKVVDVREGRARHVEGSYPKEIKPLADELNTLIGHNREVVEYARTHVANLAHALKTPLAVLTNEADSSKNISAQIVKRQTDTMSKQVDHHLRRARAAARGQAIGEKTNVLDTVSSLVRTLQRIYRDKDLDISVDIAPNIYFRGEKRDLEEIVGNLLDNACKWTKGNVSVQSRPQTGTSNMLDVIVCDNGPGLDPNEYAEVLKRGTRLDETTPGTGFGLSIVQDLTMAYKGAMRLGRAEMGGLAVTVSIPYITEPAND